jgi:hypothetical protein
LDEHEVDPAPFAGLYRDIVKAKTQELEKTMTFDQITGTFRDKHVMCFAQAADLIYNQHISPESWKPTKEAFSKELMRLFECLQVPD